MTELKLQNAKRQVSRRHAVFVLGMHRSGTSALSGMLAKLGVQPPKSLMVPTKDNPRGYWESTALMRFHDEALVSAGTVWSDWDRFNPVWLESIVAEDFIARLPEILEQEYGDARLFLVKDPRVCRLLPLWLRVLAELRITPKFVLPVRHPLEVAQSLEVRNEFGKSRACLIWLRHMLDAEYQSRGYQRVFVNYSDLLADWRWQAERISQAIDIKWPKWSGGVEADIDGYLTEELRHHSAGSETRTTGEGLNEWIAQAHQALLQLAADGPAEDAQGGLDHVREELDRSGSIYASATRECEIKSAAKIRELKGHVDETNRKYDGLMKSLSDLTEALTAKEPMLLEQLSSDDSELGPLIEQVRVLGAAGAVKEQLIDARLAEREADFLRVSSKHEAELADMRREIDALNTAMSERESRHNAKINEVAERCAAETRQLAEAKQRAEESLQGRFTEIAKLTSIMLEFESCIATERKTRSDEKSESDSRTTGLERELDLYRRLASERGTQLRLIQQSRLWKAAEKLRRLVKPSRSRRVVETIPASDDETIRKSGLFDQAWYLKRYSDVRKKGVDPLKHYLRYGASEGRDPGPGFSTKGYLRRYPDVAASGVNPLLHYVRYGIGEGRVARDPGAERRN